MIGWILFVQILILMLGAGLLVEAVTGANIDKRREDDIKRKEAGL